MASSPGPGLTRWLAVVVVVFVLLSAGCIAQPAADDDSEGATAAEQEVPPIEFVPNTAVSVQHFDAAALEDDETARLVAAVSDDGSDPGAARASMHETIDGYGLDPAALEDVVAFGLEPRTEDIEPGGVIVHGQYDDATILAAVEHLSELEFTAVEGDRPGIIAKTNGTAGKPAYVAALRDDVFVVGTERAVRDAVAVAADEAPPVRGRLRSEYEAADDGLLVSAAVVPESSMAQSGDGAGPTVRGPLADIQTTASSFSTPPGRVRHTWWVTFENESSAREVTAILQAVVDQYRRGVDDPRIATALDAVEVHREGSEVTIQYEDSIENAVDALRALPLGSGGSSARS